MGKRGPKPKQSAGAGGRRPLPSGAPTQPPDLRGEALAEWRRVVPVLHDAGILCGVDRAAIVAYCLAWAALVESSQMILRDGYTIAEKQQNSIGQVIGEKLRLNPMCAVQKEAFAQVRAMLAEFGLTPASRVRMDGASDATPVGGNRIIDLAAKVAAARGKFDA